MRVVRSARGLPYGGRPSSATASRVSQRPAPSGSRRSGRPAGTRTYPCRAGRHPCVDNGARTVAAPAGRTNRAPVRCPSPRTRSPVTGHRGTVPAAVPCPPRYRCPLPRYEPPAYAVPVRVPRPWPLPEGRTVTGPRTASTAGGSCGTRRAPLTGRTGWDLLARAYAGAAGSRSDTDRNACHRSPVRCAGAADGECGPAKPTRSRLSVDRTAHSSATLPG